MKSYAIAILLLAYVQSQCTDGCLSCTNSNKCRVCDSTKGYYLAGDTCLPSSEKHCQVFDLSGNCLFCHQGYYTDPNADQCIALLDSGDLDQNCQRFNLERQCVQCREEFFLLGTSCLEVSDQDKITGCLMYNTKNECVECQSGKTLNLQGTQCLDDSGVNNCFQQATVKCNHCKTGYTLNPNFFLLSIQMSMESTSQNSVYQKIENFFQKKYFYEEGCLKNVGDNCLAYSDFNQCIQCASQHYLQNGKCYAFPKEQIENCRIYLNQLKCKECQQGYILTGTKNCLKIENNQLIDNCVLYNPQSQNIQCSKCKTNYFVNSSLSCNQRQKDIPNCQKFSFNSDRCETCQDNYHVTDDGLKCLFKINNCLTYKTTSNSSSVTKHICEVCNSGLYFNELQNTCEQGSVQNCEFYGNDPNKCTVCQNEYYLENDVCAKHEKIQNCEIYDKTEANQCNKCDNRSILMTKTNNCDHVEIQGCEIFNSTSSCSRCKDGYDLTDNLCTLINSELNCKRSENGVCKLCLDQYFLASDNKCYLPLKYQRFNCFKNKNDGTSSDHISSKCDVCQDFSIPFNLNHHNACVSVNELSLIDVQVEIPNCERYQVIGNSIKCKQCEKTFILNSDQNECSLNCPDATPHKLNFKFEQDGSYGFQYKNYYYCAAYADNNVQSVTLDQDFQITSYKLKEGYNYLIDFSKIINFKLVPPENIDQVTVSQDLYTLPDFKETSQIQPSDNTINDTTGFIDSLGNKVKNCEYYFEKHSQYKCAKCEFGYFGKIDFFQIKNCYQYNETDQKCDLCVHQYKLADDRLSCTHTVIPGCSLYEKNTAKCTICDDQFYLDKAENKCKKSTITNCKIHDPFAEDKCLVCNKGYLLNQDNNLCGKIIDNCQQSIFKADKTTVECVRCDFGYYSQNNQTECVEGSDDKPKCYEYESDANVCETYINIMQVTQLNQCLNQKYKCQKFDDSDPSQCVKCYEEDHYLVTGTDQQEGVCCKYYTYPNLIQDHQQDCSQTDTNNPDCKKFKRITGDKYECSECKYGYFMNPSAQDPADENNTYPSSICCPWGTQQEDSITKNCIEEVIAKDEDVNLLKCSVYDLDKEECQLCKDGLYLHKKKCCTIGKYHTGNDNFTTLCSDEDIPVAQNCNKYNDDNDCIDCKDNYTLSNGICCLTTTSFAQAIGTDSYQCKLIDDAIPNCEVIKSSTWDNGSTIDVCKTCNSDYYLTNDDKSCCKKAINEDSEIFDTECKSLSSLNQDAITNCEIYTNNFLCKQCTSGYPSTQGKICCESQKIYDFDETGSNLNCRNIDFVYENCDYIIKFTSQNNFCKQCKDGYYKINNRCSEYGKYMLKLEANASATEDDTNIQDSLLSFAAGLTTSNCNKIEYVSTQTNPDDANQTINKICKQCKDGYVLNDQYNEGNYAEIPCIDEKYKQGYYLDSDITNELQKINTYTEHCLLFDQINNVCQQTQENDVFSFGYCINYGSFFAYKLIQNQPCCKSHQYYDTGDKECKDTASSENCLIKANDDGDCKVCDEGYMLNVSNQCVQYYTTANCLISKDDTTCLRCEFGYYLTTTANTTCTVVPQNTRALDYCARSSDGSACDDIDGDGNQGCHPGYYKSQDYCCRLGTYQRENGKECVSIPFDNCAKYNGTVCTECFTFQNNYCFNMNDWVFKISAAFYSPFIEEQIPSYTNYDNFKDFYYSMDKGCCKEGYYWNVSEKKCDKITVSNCLRAKTGDNQKCIKCEANYKLDSNEVCVLTTQSDSGFYQSNGFYCPEYQYYDLDKKKCFQHPDLKCKQASNNYSCDQCDSNFVQSTFYQKLTISHDAGERDGCFTKLPVILFKPCVQNVSVSYPQIPDSSPLAPIKTQDDLFDYDKMFNKRKNCNDFDFDTQICKADNCEDGYYLVQNRCCKKDQYPLNDSCINKEEMHSVCNSYDIETYTCLGCEINYKLSNGFCCKEGSQYDVILKTCVQETPNCKEFISLQNTCIECYTGYYMDSNNYCCPLYQYYDVEQQQCMKFSGSGMIGCKKGNKDFCYECSQKDHFYFYNLNISNSFQKTKGKCCQHGFKYDNDIDSCVPLLENCKEQDVFENCISCADGYHLSDIICCPYGYVSDGDETCELYQPESHCQEWEFDAGGSHTCNVCIDGYYLVQTNCCPYYYTWDDTNNKCIKIDESANDKYQRLSSINCKTFNENTVSHDSTDYHTCNICQDGYYLSQESDNKYFDRGNRETINRCCPFNMRTQIFDNLGCEKIKAETEDGQDIITLPSPESDCIEADYLQLSSLDGSLTIDYDQQIICTRCKAGKVVHIIFEDYESQRQAFSAAIIADPSYTGTISDYVTCETKTSVHNDKCWAYFVDNGGQPTRYCLNYDHSKYYLTNMDNSVSSTSISQILPCSFGEYYHNNECRSIQEDLGSALLNNIFQNCNQITGTQQSDYVCTKCKDDYYLDPTATNGGTLNFCIAENTDDNNDCLFEREVSGGTNVCLICKPGQKMDGSDGCADGPQDNSESYYKYCSLINSEDKCNYCSELEIHGIKFQTYLTNGGCCLENQYFDTDFNVCASDDNCLAVASDDKNQTECLFCNYQQDLFVVGDLDNEGVCCKKGTVIDTAQNIDLCHVPTKDHLKQCKYFKSKTECRQVTELEKRHLTEEDQYPCFNQDSTIYYYHDGACCEEGNYSENDQCNTPSGSPETECSQFELGSTENCSKCKDGSYLTNKKCCNDGKYWSGSSCDDISGIVSQGVDALCTQYINGQCLKCSTGEVNYLGCCGNNYKDKLGKCQQATNESNIFSVGFSQCENGQYLTNNLCCPYGEYFKSNACSSDDVTDTNCLIPDKDTPAKCQLCKQGMKFAGGKCCDIGKFYSKKYTKCVDESIIMNCLNFNSDSECTQCKSDDDYYISNFMCCPLNTKYNDSKGSCIKLDHQCQQFKDNVNECLKCNDGFYVNPNNKLKCCLYGHKPNETCTQPTMPIDVNNCSEFNTDSECIECKENFNLYEQVCCPSGQVLYKNGYSEDHCVSITDLYKDCDLFDPLKLECETCKDNFYKDNDQSICCAENKHFNLELKKCIDNYPQCLKQKNDECTECSSTTYLSGLGKKKRCCPAYYYFNKDENKCKEIEIDNCKEIDYNEDDEIICKVCREASPETQLTNDHCCLLNQFWDKKYQTCSSPIKYCNKYDGETENATCLECLATHQLLHDQKKCCVRQSFYFPEKEDEECFNKAPLKHFSWECTVYDSINFKCTACRKGYYLMNDHCCEDGTYYQNSDTQDCQGSLASTPNCKEGNQSGECTKCKLGYEINTSKNCVEVIDNCDEFDADNEKCTKCNQNYFVTPHGYCCLAGQSTSDDDTDVCSTDNITIDKCVQIKKDGASIKCKTCEEGYYIATSNENICCQHGSFCTSSSSEVGTIENCKQYMTNKATCTLCYPDYSLMEMANSVKYCFPTPFDNCIESQFEENVNGGDLNPYQCTKCADGYETKMITPKVSKWIRPQIEERCLIFDIKKKYEDSSLKCAYCDHDYYLDTSQNHSCQKRSEYSKSNCEIRDLNADKCKRCDKGYSLNQDINNGVADDQKQNQCQKKTECELEEENSDGTLPCAQCTDTYTMILKDLNITNLEDMTSLERQCLLETELNEKLKKDLEPPFENPEVMPGIINECEKNYQCKDVYLNGLDINLHKYLSCHVCIEQDRIPFISLDLKFETDNIVEKGIKMFFYKNAQNEVWSEYNKNRNGKQSQCFKKNLEEFNVADREKFPSHCSIGVINANQPSIISQTDNQNANSIQELGIFCVACEPGYKPLFSDDLDYHVYDCQEITNCQMEGDKKSKSAFNECDHCKEGYYHPYTESSGLDKTQCIQSQVSHDPLCYAFDIENNYCKSCMNGFQKNYDDKCEELEIPYCIKGQSNFKTSFQKKDYRLAKYRGVEGCKNCQEGYLPLFRHQQDDYTCIYSPYAFQNAFNDSNQKYPNNCQKFYQGEDDILCSQCLNQFIVTEDQKCVAINNSHQNCVIAQDSSNCHLCNENYVLIQGQCVEKSIENCLIYKENEEELLCFVCKDGFYLSSNVCNGGLIPNCARYTSKDICQSCIKDYQLIQNEQNQTICIEVISNQNCEEFNQGQFNQMNISCSQCSSQFYLNQQGINQKVCLPFQKTDGCLKYDVNTNFSNSSLLCEECQINMYLEQGKCKIRQIKVPNCLENDPQKDACKSCADNYYLSDDQMECVPNPSGIVSCAIYNENNICILCKPSFYLMNQKCFQLSPEDSIENCEGYNDQKECMKCKDAYLLEGSVCVEKNLNNCLVYQDSKNCQLCDTGYGIESIDGVNACVIISTVPNCTQYSQTSPFPCTQCETNYFLNTTDNKCVAIEETNKISNCLRYSINQKCEACESGYVLSLNQESCILLNQISNCDTHVEQGSPFCIKCNVGYSLNKEYQCVEGSQNSIQNCLVTEMNNQNVCSLCRPGYYMKEDKNCYQSSQKNDDDGSNEEKGNEENGENSGNGDNNPDSQDEQEGNDQNETLGKLYSASVALFMILLI